LSVIEAAGRDDVTLSVSGDDLLLLMPDAAIPTALIVAEAVANAMEHGFAEGKGGRIVIGIVRDPEGGPQITVHDDGHGLPQALKPRTARAWACVSRPPLHVARAVNFICRHATGMLATLTLPPQSLASSG
jgi:two-component sensor histidine kinase